MRGPFLLCGGVSPGASIPKNMPKKRHKYAGIEPKHKTKGQTDETASGASREGAERAAKKPKNKTKNQVQKDKRKFHLEDKWGCRRTITFKGVKYSKTQNYTHLTCGLKTP